MAGEEQQALDAKLGLLKRKLVELALDLIGAMQEDLQDWRAEKEASRPAKRAPTQTRRAL